jgi:hypothetical protein
MERRTDISTEEFVWSELEYYLEIQEIELKEKDKEWVVKQVSGDGGVWQLFEDTLAEKVHNRAK